MDPAHCMKINWLPASGRVEYCTAKYWNGIVPRYIDEIFMPSLCRYSTGSQMVLKIPMQKINTG